MQVPPIRTFAQLASALLLAGACTDAVSPGPAGASNGVNPLSGTVLYVAPDSRARATADAWRSTRPEDAAQLDKIAAQPQAKWFGDWNADIRGDVDRHVTAAAATGRVPVTVAYSIPLRDCGSHSAGGAASADAYREWISDFAAGIAGRPAVVILEPDAVAGAGCLSAADQTTRFDLIAFAISALRANPATTVYLDAGNHRWHTASAIASPLVRAGIEHADGFALNVSNFFRTTDEVAYGNEISALVGGKHYVVDTGRNGLGPTADAQWCNPEGRALGDRPTTSTARPLVDAYLWIKVPGESDGSCNGNPPAGTWMPEYALGLAQRAAY